MPRKTKRKVVDQQSESDGEFYEVEELVAHRKAKRNKSKTEYYVKWKGYDHSENTWEPEQNIVSPGLIEAYWQKHNPQKQKQPSSSIARNETTTQDEKQASQEEEEEEDEDSTMSEQEQEDATTLTQEEEDKVMSTHENEDETMSIEEQVTVVESPSEQEKKQGKGQHVMKKVPVSQHPPKGMKWSQVLKVGHVFIDKHAPGSPLLAQLIWPDDKTTYCMTKTLKKKAPETLIDYYEQHLVTSPKSHSP